MRAYQIDTIEAAKESLESVINEGTEDEKYFIIQAVLTRYPQLAKDTKVFLRARRQVVRPQAATL